MSHKGSSWVSAVCPCMSPWRLFSFCRRLCSVQDRNSNGCPKTSCGGGRDSEDGWVRGSCVSLGQQWEPIAGAAWEPKCLFLQALASLCQRPEKRCRHSRHARSFVGAHEARLYSHVVNSVGEGAIPLRSVLGHGAEALMLVRDAKLKGQGCRDPTAFRLHFDSFQIITQHISKRILCTFIL